MITVLCIDDELSVVEYISTLLDKTKYRLTNINDGKEALYFLLTTTEPPDVILLDYNLPSLDGLQILRELKAHKKEYAIVFLTADETLENVVAAMKEGAMDYLAKSAYLKTELNIKIEKAYSSARENTERKIKEQALKESDDRFRIIFEMANAGIFFANYNGQIILVNKVFQELVEYSFEELYTMDFSEFTHSDDIIKENELLQDLYLNKIQQYRIEKRYVSKTSKIIWVDLAVSAIQDEDKEPLSYVGVITNISERKKNEQQLKEIIISKDKFFSIISHDLRNQFSSLKGITEILMRKENQLSETKRNMFLKLLHLSGNNAFALLEDLLKWSRSQINCFELIPERIDLHEMIKNVNMVLLNQATLKHVKIVNEVNDTHYIFADRQMISTVLRNLINNAIKFTSPEGQIVISSKTENSFDYISVKDNGVGMSEVILEKLFRIDSKHSSPGTEQEIGTGLGLILCKEFIDKHGGEITVKSKLGMGSEFVIALPVLSGTI